MIPKIIHYVWVGDAPKPVSVERCIASWKKFLPDYELVEWNNTVLAELDNEYARQAFDARKWAFVSDYLRLYALYNFGGFYFDTDLELKAPLESFRTHGFFCGFEIYKGHVAPMTALMGAVPKHKIVEDFLGFYAGRNFVQDDGSFDLTPNTLLLSKYLQSRFGASTPYDPSSCLRLDDSACIYPSHFFCTPEENRESYAIHHFDGSWLAGYSRRTLLKFSNFSIARLKRKRNKSTYIPLEKDEYKVIRIPLTKKYSLLLTREIDC